MFINRSEIKVTPSVIIGCGGKGTEAVVRCRDLVQQEIFRGNPDALRDFDPLQFLVVDSGPQPLESSGTDHGIETLSIAFDRIERVIDNPDFPASGSGVVKILRQMPEFRDYKGMLTALPSSSLGNSTCPPLGAMNFLASWNSIKEGLRARLMYWKQESKTGIKTNDWKKYNQIFIVAGLFGGTGSGTHIHLAAMLRSLLAELEIPNTAIYGIFLLPDIIENADDAGKMKLRANAYSCLKELDHFLSGNPYTLEMDTKKLIVSNTTKDMLFNKVFLVNDRNEYRTRLSPDQVVQMAGELLFHFSATTLGEDINGRLTDTPNERCNQFAPEGKDAFTERRICAYSTFGLATSRIPYEVLKENLAIDYAREVMNDILLLPDDQTAEEQSKVSIEAEKSKNYFLMGDRALRDLNLTDDQLRRKFQPESPDFLQQTQTPLKETVEEYIKRIGVRNLDEAYERIRHETETKVLTVKPRDDSGFMNEFSKNLSKLKGEIVARSGPDVGTDLLRRIMQIIQTKRERFVEVSSGGALEQIQGLLGHMERIVSDRPGGRFFPGEKRINSFSKIFRKLKTEVGRCTDFHLAASAIPFLEKVERALEEEILRLREDRPRFRNIISIIDQQTGAYSSSTLVTNAVDDDLLSAFIRDFQYPVRSRPEDIALGIKEKGLEIMLKGGATRVLEVSEFPGFPQQVAESLMRLARIEVEKLGEEMWRKSFTESGLFPPLGSTAFSSDGGVSADEGEGDPRGKVKAKVDAYSKTMKELICHSSPYLEYEVGERFRECRVSFLILPSSPVEQDVWMRQYQSLQGDNRKLNGNTSVSPYSLTLLQFRFGLPLYAIDEIEDWKDAYDYTMSRTERPLHKFRVSLEMKEPYINLVRPAPLTKSDVASLLEWAVTVSKSPNGYPIFLYEQETIPILSMIHDEFILDLYYDRYEEVFRDIGEVKDLIGTNTTIRRFMFEQITLAYNLLGQTPMDDYLSTAVPPDSVKGMTRLLHKLAEKTRLPEGCLIRFEASPGPLKVFLECRHLNEAGLREPLRRFFLKPMSRLSIKTGLSRQWVLDTLMESPVFYEKFLTKCLEARDALRLRGQSERDWPAVLTES